jgi:hypothetical protein
MDSESPTSLRTTLMVLGFRRISRQLKQTCRDDRPTMLYKESMRVSAYRVLGLSYTSIQHIPIRQAQEAEAREVSLVPLSCHKDASYTFPSGSFEPHPPPEPSRSHNSHYTSLPISTNMLTMPPRARQAPEVGQVFDLHLFAFQHSPFSSRFCKRTPGVCATVVDVELEAFAAVEDAGELAFDLAGDLEECGRVEGICVSRESVGEDMLIDSVAKFCWETKQC